MGGKSNKGKNKWRALNSTPVTSSESQSKPLDPLTSPNDGSEAAKVSNGNANGVEEARNKSPAADRSAGDKAQNSDAPATTTDQAEGELHLYPVPVKTLSGEKLELQLSPGDSVMDIRQFLLDAPETCFFTCYDLRLHTKDGSVYHLEDYNEISEVADITIRGCSLEMVAALYDDRSIRSHIRRGRELLSLSNMQTSLSTFLALQHESAQRKTADAVKVDSAEHDGLGFMEDITGTLSDLVTSPSSQEIKCVESIVYSTFNPPPSYRRLVGDLIYMDVVSLEGKKYCITGTTRGFYVNCSTRSSLDPSPSKPAREASTLIGLLQKISPKFKQGFHEILEQKASAHPFESVQSLLPPNTWLGLYPVPDHKRDPARSEDALALSFGTELIGMQRDWNEELQSCREFPHKTLQERILRGRALYKVTCDFIDAAIKGAIGVISRCIPPINPTDPECFHMYVHNNIFFSFAVDADLGYISKTLEPNLLANSRDAAGNCEDKVLCNSLRSTSSNKLPGATGNSGLCTSTNSDKEQKQDVPDLTTDASAEVQITDSEQATYASANNDLKGTKAYQEADVPGLYNLAMAIIDYRGHRVVAQSIIPGILQGDKSNSLLYGSVDNGKKICWNESFHSKVVEAAKRLHLKEHTVLDGSGNAVKLAAPIECKGIVGSDDRHYLLDLMRVTPRDVNYIGPVHRFCVLRPELVASFCEAEVAEMSQSSARTTEKVPEAPNQDSTGADDSTDVHIKADEECASAPSVHSISSEEILLNPNVFTEFKLAGNPEEIAADEAIVRKAGSHLVDVVLPKFVQDLCSLEVSPMDGKTLADAFHAHGINIRYLGKVANMVKHLPHLWDMCSTEIVVRSTKHILKDLLRESEDHDLGPAITHFFNCFTGHVSPVGAEDSSDNIQSKAQKKAEENHQSPRKLIKGQMSWSHGEFSIKDHLAHMRLTSEGLWSRIQEFARFKYQFELPDDARTRVKTIAVIRNLCLKVGITIAARKYDLDASLPFQTSDILNLQPVVKHSVPICSEAENLMESGKARLAEGLLSEAYTLFSEAFSILQQVGSFLSCFLLVLSFGVLNFSYMLQITGPLHQDVASCCRYLAMVLYHAGDVPAAIVQQHKELIINERCLGLDHPDTAHSYGNMALFYHGLNQTELALRHMSRTLLLLSLSSGPDHPDVAATFINVAMMYQDIGNTKTALRYLQEALKKNERLLGPEHIQTAVCYHALAIAFNSMGAYKLSVQHEKKTHGILVKQLGEEDSRTQDSENWIKTFKLRQRQVNAQKQKRQALDSASALMAFNILKAYPELLQAFQVAARSGNASTTINKSVAGEALLPRGRRVDERAARAAAEVRKKAVARGILVRQNVNPVQRLPPLSQLLNIINSGSTPEAPTSDQAHEPKTEPSSGPVAPTSDQAHEPKTEPSSGPVSDGSAGASVANGSNHGDQVPVGLGTSLASLDLKKQKSKLKATL
ncbi:clustered mitochondria protein-like isoform X2 [Musa acuminata AAA Group]|uniref:clustered mitochondria protein-like isoform X2 n=1 Tax=Musa acuminata AAA Group TaxID=214697 RepID=UPI0031D4DBB5